MAEVYSVRDADGGRIALMTNLKGAHGLGGRRSGEEVAANTRLIAAAPALLAACQAAMQGEPGWAKRIHEAVAKATGSAS